MKTKLGHLIIALLISLCFVFSSASNVFSGTQFSTKGSNYLSYNTTSASGFMPKEAFDLKKNTPEFMSKEAFDQKNQRIVLPDYEIVINAEENYGGYDGYDIPYNDPSQEVVGIFVRKNPVKTFTVFFKLFYGPNETDWFLITDLNDCPISEFTKQSSDNYDYVWFKVKPNHPLYSPYHAELVMCVWDGSIVRTHVFKLSVSH